MAQITYKHNFVDVGDIRQVNLKEGRRYVTPEGKHYPSVTTILGHKTPPWILAWRKRIGEEEADKIARRAAVRGTKFHTLTENVLLNNEGDHKEVLGLLDQKMYEAYRPLLNDVDNIQALEAKLYSDHLRLAGQVDCIAEYKGKLSVIDFKTSKKKKTLSGCGNYFVQTAAYAIMWEERTGIPVDQTVIIMAVEEDEPIVHIQKRDDYVPRLLELRDEYEKDVQTV